MSTSILSDGMSVTKRHMENSKVAFAVSTWQQILETPLDLWEQGRRRRQKIMSFMDTVSSTLIALQLLSLAITSLQKCPCNLDSVLKTDNYLTFLDGKVCILANRMNFANKTVQYFKLILYVLYCITLCNKRLSLLSHNVVIVEIDTVEKPICFNRTLTLI